MKKDPFESYQKYKLYIFPAVVALSSLVLIVFVIYPQIIKLISGHKDEGIIFNKSKFLETKAQTLESLNSADLSRKVNFVLNSYPTEKDFVSVMGLLQSITAQSGFSLVSMSLESGASDAKIQSYTIKLDISGSRSLLPILLGNIENSPRLMRISSVETVSGGSLDAATISLAVDVLFSSAPKEFGAVDAVLPELSQQDEEAVARLARGGSQSGQSTLTGPRGKANPFE